MENGCSIESMYGMEYGFGRVKAFRIFIGKRMIDVYWIESVYESV